MIKKQKKFSQESQTSLIICIWRLLPTAQRAFAIVSILRCVVVALSASLVCLLFPSQIWANPPTTRRTVSRRPAPPPRGTTNALRQQQLRAAFLKRFHALRRRILDPSKGFLYRNQWITTQDVMRILRPGFALKAQFLQGIPRSPSYDALEFVPRSPSQRRSFLLSVQCWRLSSANLRKVWKQQRRTYPNTQPLHRISKGKSPVSLVGQQAFSAFRPPIYYLNFLASSQTTIISISCHQDLCTHLGLMLQLAKHIDQRLRQGTPKHR